MLRLTARFISCVSKFFYVSEKCNKPKIWQRIRWSDFLTCVAGVNGEGEGERERGRKMEVWELGPSPQSPNFHPRSRSPSPSPFAPATQATVFSSSYSVHK